MGGFGGSVGISTAKEALEVAWSLNFSTSTQTPLEVMETAELSSARNRQMAKCLHSPYRFIISSLVISLRNNRWWTTRNKQKNSRWAWTLSWSIAYA